MTRYIAIPVEFITDLLGHHAMLRCGCGGYERECIVGHGTTDEEAFVHLMAQLRDAYSYLDELAPDIREIEV